MVDFGYGSNEERERRRQSMLKVLDDMFWDEPELYHALCCFVHDTRKKPTLEQKIILKMQGFLMSDGDIPAITNEVVYESTTGKRPFWLN